MNIFDYILLGVLQGFTEWLPVSSEGVITLFSKLVYGQTLERSLGLAIWLHTGTLAAAAAYFRGDLLKMVKPVFGREGDRQLTYFIVVATAASALTAVPMFLFLRSLSIPDGAFTLFVGLCLIAIALLQRGQAYFKTGSLEPAAATATGLLQGLSIIPGVSRSGVTVTALLFFGFGLNRALRLSYLMSIPAVAGAQLLLPILLGGGVLDLGMFAGALAAALTGFVTIKSLLKLAGSGHGRLLTYLLGFALVFLGLLMELSGSR
jgi:undecaprenyl-diphosphatase